MQININSKGYRWVSIVLIATILALLLIVVQSTGKKEDSMVRASPLDKVYVIDTDWTTPNRSSIKVVNVQKGVVEKNIPTGDYPQVEISPDGSNIWVVDTDQNLVSKISKYSASTMELIKTKELPKYVNIPSIYFPQLTASDTDILVGMQHQSEIDPLRKWLITLDPNSLETTGELNGCDDMREGWMFSKKDKITVACNKSIMNHTKNLEKKSEKLTLASVKRNKNILGEHAGAVSVGEEVFSITDTGVIRTSNKNNSLSLPEGKAVVINSAKTNNSDSNIYIGVSTLASRSIHKIEEIWVIDSNSLTTSKIVHLQTPVTDYGIKNDVIYGLTQTDLILTSVTSGEIISTIKKVAEEGMYLKVQ